MLGGGTFVTQNKVLPGSYINIVSASKANANVGERGTVAIALPLGKSVGNVITITKAEFVQDCEAILGHPSTADEMLVMREIFCNANKVYVYDLGVGDDVKTVEDACKTLEAYDFNVIIAYTDVENDVNTYITRVKSWRDDMGKKCQVVVYNKAECNHEGVINVTTTVSDEDTVAYALIAWVGGAEAGCEINASCTNKEYDGEYTPVTNLTQTELETAIKNGELVFHLVYDDVRVLEDINSLTTVTVDKGEDFKYNQTIRVVDQIANDIAKLFNNKYLGKIPNNKSGRVSLWADIVAHHRQLEEIQAIENYDSSLLTVEQGTNKKSVVIYDYVTPVNAMAQVYMTLVVQ